ncbi:methyltransferase, TIGR04325 family [Variovorax dokdonensis]|uniref:Methyltransferase, TIGR04325 family n=2 Tax=Variovorax dokdonensis TaxID=344883 RepID=A0ABT7N731_9BURK|nr:methyltransferase, TIGR04325 family [Variovorax dokdonensis]MDM0043756.1 methyltransferase, TIGR04325 family [Variovorax dokdonensis]
MYEFVRASRAIVNGPLFRSSRLKWERSQFLSPQNLGAHFGVYRDFAEAWRALPQSPGFNTDALVHEYVDVRTKRVFEYDYAIMHWLEGAFRMGATHVLDIGGSVGVHYYAYRRYLTMPAGLTWEIVEVPEIAAIGRQLARTNSAKALHFTTDLQAALSSSAEVWLSCGAIQYFEDAYPATLLALSAKRPAHILLNKLPLHNGEAFVTTQNLGFGSFSPVHIFDRCRFVRAIEAQGYKLEDCWDVHERSMYIPGHPTRSFATFSGLYFVDTGKVGVPAQAPTTSPASR